MNTLCWDRTERYPGEWNVDWRGGGQQNSPLERRVQREKDRREGREVRSCRLIVFQAPSLRPGVSQPNKLLLYMSAPPTGFWKHLVELQPQTFFSLEVPVRRIVRLRLPRRYLGYLTIMFSVSILLTYSLTVVSFTSLRALKQTCHHLFISINPFPDISRGWKHSIFAFSFADFGEIWFNFVLHLHVNVVYSCVVFR